MRESSGQYCCGRDASASNVASESAEAGLWQTSYNSRSFHPELSKLIDKYKSATPAQCLLDVYKEGVKCSASNFKNWGTGTAGVEFQKLSKSCPAFAAEYTAIMLRVSGGKLGHYGPLRTKAAEIKPECDSMFKQVEEIVRDFPSVCTLLNDKGA
jgi:hypothetical protein